MNFYKIGSFILFSREFSYFYIEERKRRKNNMANYNPYSTQFFPQSQGNVYIINNSMEIANIPISGGLSVALCPNESLMYIKSIQNGVPALLAYNLTLCETRANQSSDERIAALEKELSELRKQLKGGKLKDEL